MAIIYAAAGHAKCTCCGAAWANYVDSPPCRCVCGGAQNVQQKVPQSGPGTELKAILGDWLGITPSEGCSCNSMARRMNEQGAQWCESDEGMAEILGVMRAEHAKRWEAGKTRLPWADMGARQLVRLACRRARAKASA